LLCLAPATAVAADLADFLALEPPQWEIEQYEFRLGGSAAGALFTSSQAEGPLRPQGYDNTGASGFVRANARVQRILDNGMILGLRSDFLVYRDALSHDDYGNDTVERLYGFVQTGFGRVDIGEADGAAYTLGLSGPIVDDNVSLDQRHISLFRDPVTGGDFSRFYRQVTEVQASSNFAKINYVSPRLFGVQIGAAFTPSTVREPLPYTGNPSNGPDDQHDIFEFAASYSGYFSNLAVGLSAGYAHGSLKNRTPGFSDLDDWALGAQLSYALSDVKLSLGGAYRSTNAYLFDVRQALNHGGTHATHVSATVERGSWLFGGEYSFGDVDGSTNYNIAGYQVSGGYKVNTNMQISAGWQWQNFRRSAGAFYNGARKIEMNGGFLSLGYSL
jgi:hypothetical protein